MSVDLVALFDDFDRGGLSRRQLLKALGIAKLPYVRRPRSHRASAAERVPAHRSAIPHPRSFLRAHRLENRPARPSLGQVVDYPKEAAYYAALMNWKIRSDDGKQALLDIGDWGGLSAPGRVSTAAGAAAVRARGPGGGAVVADRGPRLAVFDGFCWGIEPWDAKKVEAELEARAYAGGR
jgi:hypothetical protein